jgi:alkylation response protein AidB-like acyl-CoA dehydrogenase
MDFELSEEMRMIQETARNFADKEIAPVASELERNGTFPHELLKKAAPLGFCGMLIPEEYGGAGLGNLALSLVLIEINRACASTGVTLSVQNSLGTSPIIKYGTEEQKKKYLPRMATGELIGAYALTEPGCGSDAAALTATARKDGDHYVLNGVKSWITQGDEAGIVIVYARTSDAPKAKGISCFIVETDTPGFVAGKKEDKLGIRASSTVEIRFEDCKVPASALLGEENKGFKIAMSTLDGGRIGIASQSIGIAEACLEASIKYSKERVQFGKPIAHFQAIQWKLAEMKTRIEASKLLTYKAAMKRDLDVDHVLDASMAKLMSSTTANFCAREAVQIHGGAGYLKDFPVERYMRDARITEIYEGTTEIQRLVIARNILG